MHPLAPPDIQFRAYREQDFDEVARLWTEINLELAPDHLLDAFRRYIDVSLNEELAQASQVFQTENGGRLVVVTHGGCIIGTFGLQALSSDTAELRRMYLATACRGKGIAQAMLRKAEADARAAGFRVMRLSTADIQRAAVAFYTKSGFRLVTTEIEHQPSSKSIGGGITRHHFEKTLQA